MKPALSAPSKAHRLSVSKGNSALGKIDPAGGRWGGGIIPGVSLCTRGEALGHGMWIDDAMIKQIVDACNGNPKLLKSRFAHPDWCDDGTGKVLGTIENCTQRGDQAIGDFHLYKSAHNAPDGDLAAYVMSLAAEDPANFGLSIVFEHDREAEELFESENTKEVELKDDSGQVRDTDVQFISPDPLNTNHLPHCRIAKLWAADVVDDPAANAAGLFHRQDALQSEAKTLLDYIFQPNPITPIPAPSSFNIAPERIRDFVTKYLAKNGLTIERSNPVDPKEELDANPDEKDPKDEGNPDNPDGEPDEKPTDPEAKDETETGDEKPKDKEDMPKDEKCSSGMLQKFVSRFGAENGSAWAIEGISYETALERHGDLLTASLTDANERLKFLGQEGTDPVKFSHPPKKDGGNSGAGKPQPSDKFENALGSGLARVAAAIEIPRPSNN